MSGHSSIVHYLRVLRRGALAVLATFVVFTAAAVFLSLRQQPLYRASAEVFLNSQDLVAALSGVAVSYFDPVRDSQTQADLAGTPPVAQRAIQLAGVRNRTPDELLGSTSVSASSNADVLTFSVTDTNAAEAAHLATSYAKAYTSYRQQLDTQSLERARVEIQQRLDQLTASRRSALYANLTEKEQQLRTMEVLQGSKTLLIRSAGGAAQIQPRPARNGILGGVLGLVFGIGLAFLLDALNTRVRTTAEVQERLDLPLLGRVAGPPRRQRTGTSRLVMLHDPRALEAEAYRILGTNLEFVNLDRGAKTIMITSALRAEGKSTTAANLSVTLARTGHRVTLVDLDLRLPTIHKVFGIEEGMGLAHVILGRATLEEALVKIPVVDDAAPQSSSNGAGGSFLQVLQTGPLPPNPSEFLDSRALTEILSEVQRISDIVIVDSPPLLGLSDAVKLTRKVDALVVVARLSLIKRPTLSELHRVLDAAPTAKLGIVVTGATPQDGYGYGYGYAYGYGQRAARREKEPVS